MDNDSVIFFNQRWTSGGIESIITKLIDNTPKEANINYVILVSQKESDVYDDILKENNVKLIELNNKIIKNPLLRNIRTFNNFIKAIRQYKSSIMHINIYNSMSNIYAAIAYRNKVKNIIVHAHNNGFDNDKFKLKTIINNISRRIFYNKNVKYIACSEEAAKFCFNSKALNNCEIINNCIQVELFRYNVNIRNEYRHKFNINDNFVVGNIGRMVEQKNQLRLLGIFYEIKKIKNNAKLVLIGEGPLRDKIGEKIVEYSLINDVIILNRRSDVNNILQMIDCFVYPSIYEGYGIAVIESQAAGVPTFYSDNLCKNLDATKNAHKISLDDSDENIANYIVANSLVNREIVSMDDYDIKNMVSKLLNIYKLIIK